MDIQMRRIFCFSVIFGILSLAGYYFGWVGVLSALLGLLVHGTGHNVGLAINRVTTESWTRVPYFNCAGAPRPSFFSRAQESMIWIMPQFLVFWLIVLVFLGYVNTGKIYYLDSLFVLSVMSLVHLLPIKPFDGYQILRVAASCYSRVTCIMLSLILLVTLSFYLPVVYVAALSIVVILTLGIMWSDNRHSAYDKNPGILQTVGFSLVYPLLVLMSSLPFALAYAILIRTSRV